MGKATSEIKSILIVDDEKLFLKSVTDGLKPFEKKNKFKVLNAANGKEALQLLKSQEVALLVTDLRMPEMDGITLISHVHNQFPTLSIIVMTAFGSPQIEKQVKDMGILHYLEKPISFDDFRDHVLSKLNQKKRGRIEGITLASFLQLLWMEKSTCTLIIKSVNCNGILGIHDGELRFAKCDGEEGREAALHILSWPNVIIEMEEAPPQQETIKASIEELLLESFRLQDEKDNEPSIEYEELTIQSDIEVLKNNDRVDQRVPTGKSEKLKLNTLINKEVHMNVQKLNKAIDVMKETLGPGYLAADIFGSQDLQSVAGFNSNPAACALFGQIINSTNMSLKESGFPVLGKYCLFDLADKKMVVLIPMGDFIWGQLIDSSKIQLGLLLNIALPKAIAAFEDAITS